MAFRPARIDCAPDPSITTTPTRPRDRTARRTAGFLACLFLAILPLITGCYSFSGSSLPSHIETVAVPTLGNDTLEPALGRDLTDAIVDMFLRDGRLRIGSASSAHAVVEGKALSYDSRVFGLGDEDSAQEYRVTIRMSLRMKDRVKGKDLWSDEAMVAFQNFRLDGTGEFASETAARAEAVRRLAEDVLDKTLEEW